MTYLRIFNGFFHVFNKGDRMIRKLRLKFVAICMLLVTAVLAVVLLVNFVSLKQNVERLSSQVLHRVMEETGSPIGPSWRQPPEIGIDIGGERIMLPYFTVNIWGGSTAYVTGGTYTDLEDTQTLAEIIEACLASTKEEGTLPNYRLRYLRQNNGLYQRVAFVDMSMELAMLRQAMSSSLLIAAAALLLLLLVSVLLSFWATRPVENAWKQQRQFLSNASHELKTPLTVILSNAELLTEATLPEKPSRWTDNIRSEALQMKTLVEEMLTLARADNAAQTAVMTNLSFSDIAQNCALAFEPVAFETGKHLEYQIQEDISVLGDGDQLHRLISILLDNAIKYGAAGGTVTLTLQKADRLACLVVSNPGVPIPAKHLDRLFERFYRADPSRGEQSGFGLGLPIALTIATEHKGSLKAESDAISTRFIFTIPLQK